MDLSGIFINSSAAARVCTTLQTKNATHNSQRDSDLSKERRKEGERTAGIRRGGCYHVMDSIAHTKQTYHACLSSSTSLDDLCLLKKAHADTHTN